MDAPQISPMLPVLRFRERGYPARPMSKERREGIGAALRVGYSESRGAVILSMDADLSFDPADLVRLHSRVQQAVPHVSALVRSVGVLSERAALRPGRSRPAGRTLGDPDPAGVPRGIGV